MEACLAFLKEQDVVMGIITNGQSGRQRGKLHTLALERYIPETNWIISGEAGMEKPDPGIFHYAAEKLGIPEDEAWFIGDAFEADIVGAASAGWHTIWINHRQETAGNCVTPDHAVASFSAFFQLLQALFCNCK